jgi:hypothetical protein
VPEREEAEQDLHDLEPIGRGDMQVRASTDMAGQEYAPVLKRFNCGQNVSNRNVKMFLM